MNREIENLIKAAYAGVACTYRQDDEMEAAGMDHRRVGEQLAALSTSFNGPITALDVGCGTGRYFHCLKNTRRLIALDVSPEMLQEARHPLKEREVSIDEIELLCGNVHSQAFPAGSFDLIYSIGVFGNGCEINRELVLKFHGWLTPDGCVFFDVFDSSELTPLFRIREKVRNYFQQHLGLNVWSILRRRSGESLPFYDYSSAEMAVLLQSCGFFPVAVSPQECQTPLGPGKKLECLGYKSSQTNSKPAR